MTWRTSAAAVVLLLASCVAQMAISGHQSVVARDPGDLSRVELGWPLRWWDQDQSSLEPVFPVAVTLTSPWDHPVTVDRPRLIVDVVLPWSLGLAASAPLVLRRRPRRPRPLRPRAAAEVSWSGRSRRGRRRAP